jgi:hypothetical protein
LLSITGARFTTARTSPSYRGLNADHAGMMPQARTLPCIAMSRGHGPGRADNWRGGGQGSENAGRGESIRVIDVAGDGVVCSAFRVRQGRITAVAQPQHDADVQRPQAGRCRAAGGSARVAVGVTSPGRAGRHRVVPSAHAVDPAHTPAADPTAPATRGPGSRAQPTAPRRGRGALTGLMLGCWLDERLSLWPKLRSAQAAAPAQA